MRSEEAARALGRWLGRIAAAAVLLALIAHGLGMIG